MRKFGTIEKLLYRCAGVSLEGLMQCPESERRKYGFIGAIIILTSLFAMLSGGYALYYIFNSTLYAVIFALLWGTFILNIDRFIVSSMRKTDSFWREFGQAVPRMVLAFVIALVISRPLEIRIFADEIKAQLLEKNGTRREDVLKDFNAYINEIKQGFNTRISKESGELEKYLADRAKVCSARDAAHARYLCERDGTCGTTSMGYGPVAAARQDRYVQLDRECAALTRTTTDLQRRINMLRNSYDLGLASAISGSERGTDVLTLDETSEIKRLKAERDKRLKEIEQGFSTSFSSMNSALWALQNSDKSVMAISFVISLLFIVVEVSPVLVKLLARKGPYDYYLDFEMDHAEAQYQRGREMLNKEKSTAEFQREIENLERQKKFEMFKAFSEAKTPHEKEMLGKMIEQWKSRAELSGEEVEQVGSRLKHMMDDYAKITAPQSAAEAGAALPRFRYPTPSGALQDADDDEEEESSSGMRTLIDRFLIVPMTIIVTVVSFMMALGLDSRVSPYLVSMLSGLLYITMCTVYFSIRAKS